MMPFFLNSESPIVGSRATCPRLPRAGNKKSCLGRQGRTKFSRAGPGPQKNRRAGRAETKTISSARLYGQLRAVTAR